MQCILVDRPTVPISNNGNCIVMCVICFKIVSNRPECIAFTKTSITYNNKGKNNFLNKLSLCKYIAFFNFFGGTTEKEKNFYFFVFLAFFHDFS